MHMIMITYVNRAAAGWHVCLIYISYGICARMRMLHGPITARAPALLLQFQTRVLAPKKLKSDARARVPWIWNRHHVRRHHAGGPAPTGVMLITTGITGMSGRQAMGGGIVAQCTFLERLVLLCAVLTQT